MSETSYGKLTIGSFESIAHPLTDSDHACSTSENDSQDYVSDKGILISKTR
jgi:hypothetical protein